MKVKASHFVLLCCCCDKHQEAKQLKGGKGLFIWLVNFSPLSRKATAGTWFSMERATMKLKNKGGELSNRYLETNYKAIVIKTMRHW